MALNLRSMDLCLEFKLFNDQGAVTMADAALPVTAVDAITPFVFGSVQEPRKSSRLALMTALEPLSVF